MFSINTKDELLYFKDIKPVDLPVILEWYNKVDDFKFATGMDTPITLGRLTQKYAEVAICSLEYFVGIYSVNENKMIGIIKGSLNDRNKDTAWISSIVIDTKHQNKGFGSRAVTLLINFFKTQHRVTNIYLAVVQDNHQGREFWIKHNFQTVKMMENHLKLQNIAQNVIIMHKQI